MAKNLKYLKKITIIPNICQFSGFYSKFPDNVYFVHVHDNVVDNASWASQKIGGFDGNKKAAREPTFPVR